MEDKQLEDIMQLIILGGNAKGLAIKAIRLARQNEISEAKELLENSKEELNKAHGVQTSNLVKEAQGDNQIVTLMMVHGQDHVMNAITTYDLAQEMVLMYEQMGGLLNEK